MYFGGSASARPTSYSVGSPTSSPTSTRTNTPNPSNTPPPTYTSSPSASATPAQAYVKVQKVHDSNGNGRWDEGEQLVPGWEIEVDGGSRYSTGSDGVAFIPLAQGDHKIF